ncbi:enoyl-CoA hydratase/isomerase family protein [Halobacillus sp. A5]|uniref:enoyl-CoA hydratase/isomerase family protein n=1 Tax=Halobacillus sp. A5 TaxID=2880263 RepID=UPI0020A6C8DD|nr:enoyl-CoA hydratase/isomerase family protein [Halobacillus sp. A5]MCP3026222.1 enoyl-CoA hydratase/isomerase family protein [Halobacillus sp. A5]
MEKIITTLDARGTGTILLNRYDKMNAVTREMCEGLLKAVLDFKANPNLKCLVITGAGQQSFCAGGDLLELHGDLTEEEAYTRLIPMKQVLYELAVFPLPTYAFLNGDARGGGCEIATACDFRYGKHDGKYGFIQGKLGITPGWGGGELLYRKISADRAAHWLMDSEMYDSERAYQIGWLHKIVAKEHLTPDYLLSPFLEKTQTQLKIFKSQLLRSLPFTDLSKEMDEEVRRCASLWESEEHIKAVKNFIRTRKKS